MQIPPDLNTHKVGSCHTPQLGWLNWSLTLGQLYEALKLNIQTCHINTSYIVHPTSYIAHRASCLGMWLAIKKKKRGAQLLLGTGIPGDCCSACGSGSGSGRASGQRSVSVSISLWLCWLNICAIRSQKKSSCKNFKPQNLIHTEEKFLICFSRRCCCLPFFTSCSGCKLSTGSRVPSCSSSSCSRAW